MSSNARFSRSGRSSGLGKCTDELRAKVPEDTANAIQALALLQGVTVSEYLRDLICEHVHGRAEMVRIRTGIGPGSAAIAQEWRD